jgi:hypothetical protein
VANLRSVSEQPVLNPEHTHIQVLFTNGQMLFFPINVHDADKAINAWKGGSPAISLRPDDGTVFHINASLIIFLRQVTTDVAISMLEEGAKKQNEAAEAQRKQAAEQERQLAHNQEMRDLQKAQLAKSGIIR